MGAFTQRSQSVDYIEKYKYDLAITIAKKGMDMIQMTWISNICRKEVANKKDD